MFSSLKNLFGGKGDKATTLAEGSRAPGDSTLAGRATPFLRREAIFDRSNRLAGHLFSLQQTSLLANADSARQRSIDKTLLDTLNASTDAWNTSLAFIPLGSGSLDLPAIERLKTSNIVLIIQLAEDAEADLICEAIDQLKTRGLQFGLFRQPKHPAFAKVIQKVDFAAIDIDDTEANSARDFSAAVRSGAQGKVRLIAIMVESVDHHRFCYQWHYDYFHGNFASVQTKSGSDPATDPHKALLLNLMRLVQGDAENAEIANAMKQDPLLSFRIMRYLNSPALGLSRRIDSLGQALIILGRQRLTRWLAVLLFSVKEPNFSDWLEIESSLTRGRLMEVLGERLTPGVPHDPLFLTGIFSCLDRLLHKPIAEIIGDMPLADEIRQALVERSGPYAPLLAVAIASENLDQQSMQETAQAAGLTADDVNQALLAATAWASEVTEYWE